MAPVIYDGRMSLDFTIVLRGYDRQEVDTVLGSATASLRDGGDSAQRAAARDLLKSAEFGVVLRGYDRSQVDVTVKKLLKELDGPVPAGDLRQTLASVLRIPEPTDQSIVDEVRRLRELTDRHGL
jgi:hypothetical protein